MPANPFDQSLEQVAGDALPDDNEFLRAAKQIAAGEQARTKTSWEVSTSTPPERAANIATYARHYQAPESFVSRNYDDFQRRYESDRVVNQTRDTPALAGWLGTPNNASLARDDVPNLRNLERTLQAGQKIAAPPTPGDRWLVSRSAALTSGELAARLRYQGLSDTTAGMIEQHLAGPGETTRLDPAQEQAFRQWAAANQIADVDKPDSHYDYRGYFLETKGAPHEPGTHFPDTYKQHGHPTFSQESKYSKGPADGGTWEGEVYTAPDGRRINMADPQQAAAWEAEFYRRPDPMQTPAVQRIPENVARSSVAGVFGGGYANIAGYVQMLAEAYSETKTALGDVAQHIRSFPSIAFQGWGPTPVAPKTAIGEGARQQAEAGEAFKAAVGPPPANYPWLERQVYGGFESLGANVPGYVAGMALGGGPAAALLMGASTAGGAYRSPGAQGLDTFSRVLYAHGQGTIETALELAPAGAFFEDLAHNAPFRELVIHQLKTELPGELATTALQNLNDWAELPANKKKTFGDYLREQPSELAATAVSTIVMIGASTAAGHAANAFFQQLGETAQASKTIERDPNAVADHLNESNADTPTSHVYLPTDSFTTFWQTQGVDPRAKAAQLTGSIHAYDTAVSSNQDLVVPMGAYVTQIARDPQANAFFINEARLDPEHNNLRELEERKALTGHLAERAAKTSEEERKTAPIRETMQAQLVAVGETPERADYISRFVERVFSTLATRANVDPVELFERYGLRVARPHLETPEVKDALARIQAAAENGRTQEVRDFSKSADPQVAAAAKSALGAMRVAATEKQGAAFAEIIRGESPERLRGWAESQYSNPQLAEAARNELARQAAEGGAVPAAAPAEGAATVATDRGLLHDEEVALNANTQPDAQGFRRWESARSTDASIAHATEVAEQAQDGEVWEDSTGERFVVKRSVGNQGQVMVSLHAILDDGSVSEDAGNLRASKNREGNWYKLDTIRSFFERARRVQATTTEEGAAPTATAPAAESVIPPAAQQVERRSSRGEVARLAEERFRGVSDADLIQQQREGAYLADVEIERRLNTDALTGLGNGNAFQKAREAAEADPNVWFIVFDVNNFKTVNDTYGHATGDQALVDIGAKIKQAATEFGAGERVFRNGGDEYAVLAPPHLVEQIRDRAEALVGIRGYSAGERAAEPVPVSLTGVVGPTYVEADVQLKARKEARKRAQQWVPSAIDMTTAPTQTGEADVTSGQPAGAVAGEPVVGVAEAIADRVAEGERQTDDRPQRDAVVAAGMAPGEGVPSGAESERPDAGRFGAPGQHTRGLPEYGEVFDRRPVEENRARFTPAVVRELNRILAELAEFPYVKEHWDWNIPDLGGNVAGGHAQRTPARAGAEVYNDIRAFSPVNTKVVEGERVPAKEARGDRAKVAGAVMKALEAQDIPTNLVEGAVRVAELRAAEDYSIISSPWLPHLDGFQTPRAFVEDAAGLFAEAMRTEELYAQQRQLSAETLAILQGEQTTAAEPSETDVSDVPAREFEGEAFDPDTLNQPLFDDTGEEQAAPAGDVLETGEVQPRLPGAEAVRETEVATPEVAEAPFALTPPPAKAAKKQSRLGTLFQALFAGAPTEAAAEGPAVPDDKPVKDRPWTQTAPAAYEAGYPILSSRVPSAKKLTAQPDVLKTDLPVVLEAGGTLPARMAKSVTSMTLENAKGDDVPAGVLSDAELAAAKTPEQVIEKFVDRLVENLRFLWNTFPEELKARAMQWYDGAHRIAQGFATAYEITHQQASGVLAALSPQMDWFRNVSLAERVIRLVKELNVTNPTFDRKLFDEYAQRTIESQKSIFAKIVKEDGQDEGDDAYYDLLNELEDKRKKFENVAWRDLPLEAQALMLRAYDERTARTYPVITPEGRRGDLARNEDGTERSIGWGAYAPIENAISILHDGTIENVHLRLGKEHKVRSFFNNISAPWNADFVTIDTHAVAAALLQPLSGEAFAVKQAMSGPAEAKTGISGTNALYAEAYNRFARELGVLPREVQSVIWEAGRALFRPEQKREGALVDDVTALWAEFRAGTISLDELQRRTAVRVGGMARPAWADAAQGVAGDEGGIPARVVPAQQPATRLPARRGDTGEDTGQPAGPAAEQRQGAPRADQPQGLTPAAVSAFADRLKQQFPALADFDLYLTHGTLALDRISVAPDAREQGIGTQAMQALTQFADQAGVRIVLTPAQRDRQFGTTGRGRLIQFYKQFGFVENKGRNKDFTTRQLMYRDPKAGGTLYQEQRRREVETSPAFQTWFGDSQVLDDQGNPQVVYHGTTGDFTTFDRTRANIESDWGGGFYFSNTPEDVAANYANEAGPDLEQKVQTRVERLEGEYDYDAETKARIDAKRAELGTGASVGEAAILLAREDLGVQHGGATVPVYLKIENPAIVGGPNETRLEMTSPFDEEGEPTDEEPTGTLADFVAALRDVSSDFHDDKIDDAINELLEAASYESIGLAEAVDILKKSEGLIYATDENGNLASSEIIRQALEQAGFDGIIDNTVNQKFGSERRLGKQMEGMEPDTVHYIAFQPEQIKSAISNRTFAPAAASMLEQGDTPAGEAGAEGEPPARGGYTRVELGRIISLFEKADETTLLHELSHFFFDVMTDLASDPSASPQIQADVRTMLDAGGHTGDLASWHALSLNEQRKAHEHFAESFERYLATGKAPSVETQTLFSRFRAWMLNIYKVLDAVGITLSPEVRGVFDRMIATDEAIADAEAERDVPPLFATHEQANVSRARFEQYRQKLEDLARESREKLERKVLDEHNRQRTAEWKAQREAIETTVRSELNAQPAYRALTAMQRGTNPDGTPLVEGLEVRPQKLSRQILVERFGKARLAQIAEVPGPYLYTRSDQGLDPDMLAELYGFSSGDEMLRAVVDATPYEQAVKAETDRRMLEQHGDLVLEDKLAPLARNAIMNDSREQLIREELKMLADLRRQNLPAEARADLAQQKAEQKYERRWLEAEFRLRIAIAEGRKQSEIDTLRDQLRTMQGNARGGAARINAAMPSAKDLRAYAAEAIGKTQIRDLRPQLFWSASRKSGQQAVDHAARQNFDAAITAKQQELVNLALYREATRVLEAVDTRTAAARDLARGPARARLGLAGDSYLDQVDGILDQYDFARASQKVLDRRAGIRAWVAALQGDGLPVELPEAVLDDARRINYRELTVEQFMAVTDGLAQIAHLAQLKNKLLTAKKQRDFATTRDGIVNHIEQHNQPRPKVLEILPKDQPARRVAEWFASHTKLAEFIARLDGYVAGGPLWDAIMRPLNDAATRQTAMQEQAGERLGEILEAAYTQKEIGEMGGPGYLKSKVGLGQQTLLFIPAINASLSKQARLAVALNWGNEGNRQRLMESGARGWNAAQVQAILDTLDERDLKFVQDTLDYINSYWGQIDAQDRRLKGLPPEKVEPASWRHSQFGEQRGGYYPIAYDGRLSVRADALINASEANLQAHAAYTYASTRHGYTKERAQKVDQPVRLELSVMYEHLEQIIHSLTHREVLVDVGRLLADRKIQQAIVSTQGDIVYKQMRDAVLDVALGTQHATTVMDRALNFLRNGGTLAGLGWNVWTAVQQPIGMVNGAVIIGPKWMARGLYRFLRDTSTMEWSSRWVYEKSEMMRHRGQTAQRDIAEMRSTFKKSGSWFDRALRTVTLDKLEQQDITDSYMALIEVAQKMADMPTFIGAYEKYRASGETEDRAVALAEQAVLDSQSGGQVKDLAKVQRGAPAFKLFTMFYSYGNLIYNQTARVYGRDWVHSGSTGQFVGNLALLYIAPAALTVALAHAFGRSDDKENWVVGMGKEILATAMNMFWFVREGSAAAQTLYSGATGSPAAGNRGYEGPSGVRLIASAGKLAQQVAQGKADRGLLRASEDVAGVIFKLPLGQVQRSIDGFVAIHEGRTHNPLALLAGAPAKKASGQ